MPRIRNSLDVILVFLMAVLAYGYFLPAVEKDWNQNSRLALVKAVVEQRRLEIDSFQTGIFFTGDKAFFRGHYYSDKAIGTSLIGIAFYLPIYVILRLFGIALQAITFKQLIGLLAISLPSALLAPLIYVFTKRRSRQVELALLVTAAICFGTSYFKYSTLYYGHTIAALLLFAAFFIWAEFRRGGRVGFPGVFLSALLMGFLVITEYPTSVLLVPLGLYILFTLNEQKRILDWRLYSLLIMGFLLPISILLLYNHAIFGNPFMLNYAHEASADFRLAHEQGIMGIGLPDLSVLFYTTFHPSMGVFWASPMLVLAFVGWYNMFHGIPVKAEALFSLGAILLYFILLSGFYTWWGGLAFTPRHLIPVLPLFAIPLSYLPRKYFKLMVALTLLAIMQMLIVTASSRSGLAELLAATGLGTASGHLNNAAFLLSTIYDVYILNFLRGLLVPNLMSNFAGFSGRWTIAPLIGLEGVLAYLVIRFGRRAGSPEGGLKQAETLAAP